MPTFFTADTHFGHARLLRKRPAFADGDAHDEAIIARWNATVGPEDTVWHLGDFAHGASRERCADIFARLNGVKRLVRGNHDTNRVLRLPWSGPVVETATIRVCDEDRHEWRFFLAHYAHRSWPGVWRGTRHLYGHAHASLPDSRAACDVGVDAWDFAPVGIAALVARQDAAASLPEELALAAPAVGG